MTVLLLLAAAALNLAAAANAQVHLPDYTAGAASVSLVRVVLAAVGLALGYVWAAYMAEPLAATLAFLTGFGVVHVPAAAILFFKRLRGSGKS
jgi:hypothetical protein